MVKKIINIVLQILTFIIPKNKKLILFGGFSGKRYGDNSAFLFEYIVKNYPEYKAFWVSHKPEVVSEVLSKSLPALSRYSVKALWYSVRAKYLIGSHSVKDASMHEVASSSQHFIYLHHGIPLRKGWFDVKNAPKVSLHSSKAKIKCSSFMIATSTYAAEQQNKLLPIGLDKFKITGLPRNDVFFKDLNSFEKQLLDNQNITNEQFNILYAPTWREWETTKFFPFLDKDMNSLNNSFKENNIFLIIRPHHIDMEKKELIDLKNETNNLSNIKFITHNEIADINLICKFSDLLITDYSSLIYDFLIIDKPIIFLPYDFDLYKERVGFYPDMNEIINSGYNPKTQQEFINSVIEINNNNDAKKKNRTTLKNKLHKYQDGNSCERVFKEMINL